VTAFTFYGGKGGVGKTTCAAATALATADAGEATLLVSTDPAHSLSDALETPLGDDPTTVRQGLDVVELDPQARTKRYRDLFLALAREFADVGVTLDESDVEELFESGLAPGFDELAALDVLADQTSAGAYDRVVLDTAPTGHTLRLLELPDLASTTLRTAMSVRGQVRRLAATARSAVLGPAAFFGGRDDDGDLAAFRERVDAVADALRDPDRTTFRVVCLPETMAIAETARLVDELQSLGVPVGTLVVNQVLQDPNADCDRCQRQAARHEARLAEIRDRFPGREVVVLPELDGEARGHDALAELAPLLAP
jgi:arsenite-transporting ATPase